MPETLRPLDFLILCKLVANTGRTYDFLSESLGISRSQIHKSVKMLEVCGFLGDGMRINKKAFLVFALGGARFSFPVEKQGICDGVSTGLRAVGFGESVGGGGGGIAGGGGAVNGVVNGVVVPEHLVWPCEGQGDGVRVTGRGIKPLHPAALRATNDQKFWDLLALVDAIRVGDDKESKVAMAVMRERV